MPDELDMIAYKLYSENRKKINAYVIPDCVFINVPHKEFSDFYKQANKILRKDKIIKIKEKKRLKYVSRF